MRALVTGAGAKGGIGMAVARALGRAGCEVALVSTTDRIHERAAELMAEGLKATGHIADLTDAVQVAALREAVGPVQILVNNAGMGTVAAPADTRRFLDLPPVVRALADARGLVTGLVSHSETDEEDRLHYASTDWMIVTANLALLETPAIKRVIQSVAARPDLRSWSDDFNNLYRILK